MNSVNQTAVVYTINNCINCIKIKNLLKNLNISYEEHQVLRLGETGDGIPFSDYAKIHSGFTTFPQVYIDGICIGGLLETVRYFQEKLNNDQ
jgi:glutaredoxin